MKRRKRENALNLVIAQQQQQQPELVKERLFVAAPTHVGEKVN